LSHVQHEIRDLPRSQIKLQGIEVNVLWDWGSAITAFRKAIADQLKLIINVQDKVLYRDINCNVKSSYGSATCHWQPV
jgi:hypothetical protein